ncbi:MAG: protein-disulfide reductase DsbD N-terminal domain-containing protein, partial [Flavobacteriaceae bacterium]|nr:protein-disulfide reductase DsbD N-terminal domain-containing protein [Flavobacteriaceae bacterium]
MKKYYILLLSFLSLIGYAQGDDEPVAWAISVNRISATAVDLQFDATIADKWHLYSLKEFEDGPLPTEFTFEMDSLKVRLDGPMTSSEPKIEFDAIFEIDLPFFEYNARFTQRLELLDSSLEQISGEINYQACDDRLCIFRTEPFTLSLHGNAIVASSIEITSENQLRSAALTLNLKNKDYLQDALVNTEDSSPLLTLFLLGFLAGLIAILTPCVFPMIPLPVSFFLKQATSLRKGVFNALL